MTSNGYVKNGKSIFAYLIRKGWINTNFKFSLESSYLKKEYHKYKSIITTSGKSIDWNILSSFSYTDRVSMNIITPEDFITWNRRNRFVIDYIIENPVFICHNCPHKSFLSSPVTSFVREFPPQNHHLLNFDGGFRKKSSNGSMGAILRDSTLREIARDSYHVPAVREAYESEILGLVLGLKLAIDHNVRFLQIEGDCLNVINVLKGVRNVEDAYLDLYSHVYSLLGKFDGFVAKHMYREGNVIAHLIAQRPLAKKDETILDADILKQIELDQENVNKVRFRFPRNSNLIWGEQARGQAREQATATATANSDKIINISKSVIHSNGWSPLHGAANSGNAILVQNLLSRGADVNLKTDRGCSALHYAARKGWLNIAEILISQGAQMNSKDKVGCTPLHWAASAGNSRMCGILIEKGAEVDAVDGAGQSPLFTAVICNNKDVAALLISYGADIDLQDNEGYNVLGRASADLRPFLSDAANAMLEGRKY